MKSNSMYGQKFNIFYCIKKMIPKLENKNGIIRYLSPEEVFNKEIEQRQKGNLIPMNKLNQQSLISTINAISSYSSGGCYIETMEDLITYDFIPLFLKRSFGFYKIPGVKIKKQLFNSKITKQQYENIKISIKFLNEKNPNFRLINVDYSHGKIQPSNFAEKFFTQLLNCFFLKETKRDMYLRCRDILYTDKNRFRHFADLRELTSYETYFGLLCFLTKKPKNSYEPKQFTDENAKKLFQLANVPMIINSEYMKVASVTNVPDIFFYQLRFIFRAIDKKPSFVVAERLLYTLRILHQVKILNTKSIVTGIKCKEFNENKNLIKNEKINKIEIKKTEETKIIDDIKEDDTENDNSENNDSEDIKEEEEENNDLINDIDSNINLDDIKTKFEIEFDKTIIYYKNASKLNDDQIKSWEKEMKEVDSIYHKGLFVIPKYLNNIYNTISRQTKIFELFTYDESKETWIFNSEQFDSLVSNNFEDDEKVSIVFLPESEEIIIKKIVENLTSTNIRDNNMPNHLCIYAICDKLSSQFYSHKICSEDDYNHGKKLIFMYLHVPKSKFFEHYAEKVIQIYSFLSVFNTHTIAVVQKYSYFHQIKIIELINKFGQIFHIKDNVSNKFSLFLMKDQTYKSCKEIDYCVNQRSFFKNLIVPSLIQYLQVHFIDEDILQSYVPILQFFNQGNNELNLNLSTMKKNFENINQFMLSYFFINMGINENEFKNLIINLLNKYGKSIENYDLPTLSRIHKKIYSSFPPYKNFLTDIASKVFSDLQMNLINREHNEDSEKKSILKEIQNKSDMNKQKINLKVSLKGEVTKEHYINIINNHVKLLKNEYFNSIKSMFPKNSFHVFYQKYLDILNNQIQTDLKYFENEYKAFDDAQNNQRTTIKDNILKGAEKGLNYTMRQTQNLQESQITVIDDIDFERKIPQDF